jgi:hypothetical protein
LTSTDAGFSGHDHLKDRGAQASEQVNVLPILDQPPGITQLLVDEHPRPLLSGKPGIVRRPTASPMLSCRPRSIFHNGQTA